MDISTVYHKHLLKLFDTFYLFVDFMRKSLQCAFRSVLCSRRESFFMAMIVLNACLTTQLSRVLHHCLVAFFLSFPLQTNQRAQFGMQKHFYFSRSS